MQRREFNTLALVVPLGIALPAPKTLLKLEVQNFSILEVHPNTKEVKRCYFCEIQFHGNEPKILNTDGNLSLAEFYQFILEGHYIPTNAPKTKPEDYGPEPKTWGEFVGKFSCKPTPWVWKNRSIIRSRLGEMGWSAFDPLFRR